MPKYKCQITIVEDAKTPMLAASQAVFYVRDNPLQVVVAVTGPRGDKYAADMAFAGPAQRLKIQHKIPEDHFKTSELTTLLEAAREALADGVVFDALAERMDLSDDEMKRLQRKLERFMAK